MQRKNFNRTGMLTAVAVMAVLLGATCALAQGPGQGRGMMNRMGPGPGHGSGMGPGGMQTMMTEKLDLTEDQQTAITEIQEQARKGNLELRKQIMRLRNELQGEMLKDEPTQKTVVNLTQKIGDVRTQMQTNRVKTRLAVRKLLTPEQRDMMLMMKQGHHQGRGGFSGRGGQRCSGPGQGPGCDGPGPGHGPGRGFGLRNWDDD